ncbi:MAG: hypothetical protein K2N88_02960 [Muribaculaceae bacterium]|nr:hypothetical protein [Muribaculaceae bacterium]
MRKTTEELRKMIASLDAAEAIEALSAYLDAEPDDDEALTLRGLKYWGAGQRALSMNDYLRAVTINPGSRAAEALKAAREILDYRNNDLYNP